MNYQLYKTLTTNVNVGDNPEASEKPAGCPMVVPQFVVFENL
jgi:hypothetical protein